jgi:hypothetical protein
MHEVFVSLGHGGSLQSVTDSVDAFSVTYPELFSSHMIATRPGSLATGRDTEQKNSRFLCQNGLPAVFNLWESHGD